MHQSVIGVLFSSTREKVLLIKRRDVPVWVLPGGGLEPGETTEEAVLREFWEETGLKVKILRKVGEYTPLNRLAHFTHLYECEYISGKIQTGEETKDIGYFPLQKLPKLLPPPYGEWILESHKQGPLIQRNLTSVSYRNLCKYAFCHPLLIGRFFLQKLGIPFNSKD